MKRLFIALTLVFLMPAVALAELTVAVAANVQYTFEEIAAEFKKETGGSVKAVFGSSGKFTSQIENGAPFDIFLSADIEYPKTLLLEKLTHNAPEIYGFGKLVLWTMTDVDISGGMDILKEKAVKKIAIASPKTAPYGRQAVNALKYYKLYDDVHKKLVYGESIAQTNQFITSEAADVGFTAKAIVLAPNMKDQGRWVEVPQEAYEPIAQAVVILKHAEKGNLVEAKRLFDFLFSDQARAIFEKYGYILPKRRL